MKKQLTPDEIEKTRRLYSHSSYTHERREGSAVVFYGDGPSFGTIAFSGQRTKPDWHYTFGRGGVQAQDKYIGEWFARQASVLADRQVRRDAKAKARAEFVNPYKVGDLFNTSWGYEQTNVEFYQCVAVGPKSITVREIAGRSRDTGSMQGMAKPDPDHFVGDPKRVPIVVDGPGQHHLKSPDHGCSHMWKTEAEEEHSWSSYA